MGLFRTGEWKHEACDSCHKPFDISTVGNSDEIKNEMYVTLSGGYSSFIDPEWKGPYEFVVCHDCAMRIAVMFLPVLAEHQTNMVPCNCPDYPHRKERFDASVEAMHAAYNSRHPEAPLGGIEQFQMEDR